MNYIKHLAGFFHRVAVDDRLNPSHVSMYVSLFQFWNASRFENPISISRSELMRVSKISSKTTYHKCISELHEWGYIRYAPSYNPLKGSFVYLYDFGTSPEQVVVRSHTKKQEGTGQVLVSSINTLNINKQVNALNNSGQKRNSKRGQRGREKKEKGSAQKEKDSIPESIADVQDYFLQCSSSPLEAEKFYNYFSSNGWLVGGKSEMKDWKAAARNWILNIKSFNNGTPTLEPGNLHTTVRKDYSEPL